MAITDIPGGTLRVLLGEVGPVSSPIQSHQGMTCVVVSLSPGQSWTFTPPAAHSTAFAFVFSGSARVQGEEDGKALMVLGEAGSITVQTADQPAQALIGTAAPHRHPLVMGPSSVRTNAASLNATLLRIRQIGASPPR